MMPIAREGRALISRVVEYLSSGRGSLAALVAAIAVASCDSPMAPSSLVGAPDTFEFHIGGFGVGGTTARLHGDTIVVVRQPWDGGPTDTTRAVPTAVAWQRFWNAADVAGIHRWRSRYVAEDIVDGTGWHLSIESGEFRVDSHGSNAYPDSQGREQKADFTESFQRLLDAVSDLTGHEF